MEFRGRHGEMGERVRAHGWHRTALGPMTGWPASLLMLVDIVLDARQPMHIAWGPERTLIYNDAYGVVLGSRHPEALGRPCLDVWSDLRGDLEPLFERVFAGDPVQPNDFRVPIIPQGHSEEVHFTFSFTPVRDGNGDIVGLFSTCTNTTAQVQTDRRRASDGDGLRNLFQQAPSFMAVVRGPEHRFELANDAYRELIGNRDVLGLTVREALGEVDGQGFFDLLDRVYATGDAFVGKGVEIQVERRPGAAAERRLRVSAHPRS